MIKERPDSVVYVVQMRSETGDMVDVVSIGEAWAQAALGNWRKIHPGREFWLVERTTTDRRIPG